MKALNLGEFFKSKKVKVLLIAVILEMITFYVPDLQPVVEKLLPYIGGYIGVQGLVDIFKALKGKK